jgi:hypothetical protein
VISLNSVYGIPEVILHIPGKRGPQPNAKLLPPSDLHDAQAVKRRKGGRVVNVTTKIIFGSEEAVQDHLALSYMLLRDTVKNRATSRILFSVSASNK